MSRMRKILLVGGAVAALGAGGAAIAVATGAGEENEKPIEGSALDQASAAALAHTGAGTVSGTEVGDEESLYEVEVTLPDGNETDVQLDRDFNVVGSESDAGDSAEGGE